jgi:NitT/TauT family transport system permease protein
MTTLSHTRARASHRRRTKAVLETAAYRLGSVALLIIVWQGISFLVSAQYVPSPWDTVLEMLNLFTGGEIYANFAATLIRMILSFVLAMFLGTAVGVVMGLYHKAERMFDLWVMVGLGIPSLCYVIISFMWLGLNDRAAILAIAMTTFPTIAVNIWQGVKSIDQRLVDMARSFQATTWRRTTRVVLPQVLPYLVAATRFGLGIIWKVTVLVELLGMSNGVGYKLNYSFQLFNMAGVFAWTLSFTIFMIIIEVGILAPLERRLFGWRPEIRR